MRARLLQPLHSIFFSFTLKSKFAVQRAPLGWENKPPTSERNRFGECAHLGGAQRVLVVCLPGMVWVFIYGRAKRPKEKNYNIFLELYPGRQLPLFFFSTFFFVFSRTGVWSSTICRNGKIPGLQAMNERTKKKETKWREIHSPATLSTTVLLVLQLDFNFIYWFNYATFFSFFFRSSTVDFAFFPLKGAPFSDAQPPKIWKCLGCHAHSIYIFFCCVFSDECHISRWISAGSPHEKNIIDSKFSGGGDNDDDDKDENRTEGREKKKK